MGVVTLAVQAVARRRDLVLEGGDGTGSGCAVTDLGDSAFAGVGMADIGCQFGGMVLDATTRAALCIVAIGGRRVGALGGLGDVS